MPSRQVDALCLCMYTRGVDAQNRSADSSSPVEYHFLVLLTFNISDAQSHLRDAEFLEGVGCGTGVLRGP